MLRKKLRAHSIIADFKDALYKTQKHRNEKQDGYPVTRWGMKHRGGESPIRSNLYQESSFPLVLEPHRYHCCWVFPLRYLD